VGQKVDASETKDLQIVIEAPFDGIECLMDEQNSHSSTLSWSSPKNSFSIRAARAKERGRFVSTACTFLQAS
jgi:L-ribulose-5-phosphate 3-epimerase UlaE